MKRTIFGLLMLLPFLGFGQTLVEQNQGNAGSLTPQYGYFVDMNGRQLPTYSAAPTAKTGTKGTVVRVSMYRDSATGNIMMINSSNTYTKVSISSSAGIRIVVPTYAAMLSIANVSSDPYSFIVISDEKKGQQYTSYDFYPNGGNTILMWNAAIQEPK